MGDDAQPTGYNQAIGSFVDEIIEAKNLPGSQDEQVKQYLREDLSSRLLELIDKALIDALPDDKIADFEALLDKEGVSDEDLQKFIVDAGVDVIQVTSMTMIRFRDSYLQGGDRKDGEMATR